MSEVVATAPAETIVLPESDPNIEPEPEAEAEPEHDGEPEPKDQPDSEPELKVELECKLEDQPDLEVETHEELDISSAAEQADYAAHQQMAGDVPNHISNDITCQGDVLDDPNVDETVNDVSKDIPSQTDELHDPIIEDVSNDISDDVSNDISNDVSNDISNDFSNDITNDISNDVSNDITNDISNDDSNDNMNDISNDVSNDISVDVSNDISNDISNNVPNDISNDVSNDIVMDTASVAEPVAEKQPEAVPQPATETATADPAEKPASGFVRPAYIPPHLMGRDLNNPASDMIGTGRRVQKPRLGVKVPYRNLTSQIVSQDEIAQEILERSLRKYSYTDVPEGGDVFFTMKLTHRLANKITSPEVSEKKEKKKAAAAAASTTAAASNAAIVVVENRVNSENMINDTPANKASTPRLPNQNEKENEPVFDSKAEELYAEISSTLNEDCKLPKAVKLEDPETTTPMKTVNGSLSQSSQQELDDDTLLAILEGTSDLNEILPYVAATPAAVSEVSTKSSTPVSATATAVVAAASTPHPPQSGTKRKKRVKPVLDPSVEKELALRQLMDFETKKHENRLKRAIKKPKSEDQSSTTGGENNQPEGTAAAADEKKTPKRNSYSLGSAPKRFAKKYQRSIKRQLRSSKMKDKTLSPDPTLKKLPEVPEVQIAIDRYIRTYTNKRKQKPDTAPTTPEPIQKRPKEGDAAVAPTQPVPIPVKAAEPQQTDKNCNEVIISDQEAKPEEDGMAEVEELVEASPKANSKVMREINRLLGDEGAINMIYSIKEKRSCSKRPDDNHLSSTRRKKKDLLLKTKLVKSAVLRLSMSSSLSSPPTARERRSAASATVDTPKASTSAASPSRKDSIESVESMTSEMRSPKVVRKVAAEASKIIRRHSSSSAYSSDEDEEEASSSSNTTASNVSASNAADTSVATLATVDVTATDETQASAAAATASETKILPNGIADVEMLESSSTAAEAAKPSEGTEKPAVILAPVPNEVDEVSAPMANPEESPSKDKQKVKTPKMSKKASKETVQKKAQATLVYNGPNEEVFEEIAMKEVTLRKYDNLVQVIIVSSTTSKTKDTLNAKALREFTSVLQKLQKDDKCRIVLVTSAGNSFCQGIDLQALVCADETERNKIVTEYVDALTAFVKCISQFPKLLMAGVHGATIGVGVTMLPFFDMVYASSEATFYTPYLKLGQIPEAGATLTLPQSLGNSATSELLFGCRTLPASDALQFGLITKILHKDKFNDELLTLVRSAAAYSPQSVKATKQLLRKSLNTKLQEQLEVEAKLLHEHWCSEECQNRIKTHLQQEAVFSK